MGRARQAGPAKRGPREGAGLGSEQAARRIFVVGWHKRANETCGLENKREITLFPSFYFLAPQLPALQPPQLLPAPWLPGGEIWLAGRRKAWHHDWDSSLPCVRLIRISFFAAVFVPLDFHAETGSIFTQLKLIRFAVIGRINRHVLYAAG